MLNLLLESELLLDCFDQPFAEFPVVHGHHRLATVEINAQMRSFAGLEGRTFLGKPALELAALHGSIINNFVYEGGSDRTHNNPTRLLTRILPQPQIFDCGTL